MNVPEDALRVDQTVRKVGMLQGQMSDNEVAAKVARQFFELLIAKEYDNAGILLQGIPGKKIEQMFGEMNIVRIISVGPAGPHPNPKTGGLVVPCVLETEKDGKKGQMEFGRLGVRPVYNQPDRWSIFGGI